MSSRTGASIIGRLSLVIGAVAWPLLVIATLLLPPPVFATQRVVTVLQSTPLLPSLAETPHHETAINVYFSKRPDSDTDFAAVFPVERLATSPAVATSAIRALLLGPTPEEAAQGYFSELGTMLVGPSTCSGEPFTLTIADGAATLRFCQQVRSAGIGQDARVRSALEATLRQFPTVQRVTVLTAEGDCLFDMSGENRCLSEQ